MKVRLSKPAPRVENTAPVRLDKGRGQIEFVNASKYVELTSNHYRQSFKVWQKEQRQ